MVILFLIVEVVTMQKKKKSTSIGELSFKNLMCMHIKYSFAICNDCKA